MSTNPREMPLARLLLDPRLQVRVAVDQDTVDEYADLLRGGTRLPPVDACEVDGKVYIVDGWHRHAAAHAAGLESLPANVTPGTWRDALAAAATANGRHGLRLSRADRQRQVRLALEAFPGDSDRALAERLGVSHHTVAAARGHVGNCPPATRTGRDGKQYPTPPARGRDALGRPIPSACADLFARAPDAKRLLGIVSEIRNTLRTAQDSKDPVFSEVNASATLAALDRAYDGLSVAVPYAVCPQCGGGGGGECLLCAGRGVLSRFRYEQCAPEAAEHRRERRAARLARRGKRGAT